MGPGTDLVAVVEELLGVNRGPVHADQGSGGSGEPTILELELVSCNGLGPATIGDEVAVKEGVSSRIKSGAELNAN